MSTRSSTSASACASKRALVAVLLAACAACAGALEDVDRFAPAAPDAGEGADGGSGNSDGGASDAGNASGAGSADAGSADAGCDALSLVIVPSCATALCHDSAAQQGSLDLQAAGLPFRLVGRQASGGPGLLINGQEPDQSVLYLKVLAPPPFGSQMPLIGGALSPVQTACLRSWVEQAAAGQ
jgi:hypothetical protein